MEAASGWRAERNAMSEGIKLNLGGGKVEIPGYMNIDHHNGKEAYPLECADNSVDEIRASHILEHFPYSQTVDVLKNWYSKLKPGGIIKIAVPDFGLINKMYEAGDYAKLCLYVCGGQTEPDDVHRAIFDDLSMRQLLECAGFTCIETWKRDADDCSALPVSLNLMARKEGNGIVTTKKKISFAMSTPRLTFTENAKVLLHIALQIPIQIQWGEGAYWSHVLTDGIEKSIAAGSDYIFTVDYDSFYTLNHVRRLLKLMEENPEYDAIAPLQTARCKENVLFGIIDESGKFNNKIDRELIEKDVIPITMAHFGLTVFRASMFSKLKKPWFLPVPGDGGMWHENYIDDDIYFWKNMKECGMKLGLAHKVALGHMQLMVTYPDTIDNCWNPIHCYLNDAHAGKIPVHCM